MLEDTKALLELSTEELWTRYPDWMLKNYNAKAAYDRCKRQKLHPRQTPKVVVLYGPPGTGKSYGAREEDDIYLKPPGNFWLGYAGEKTVIFDDFVGSEKYTDILRWCSEAPIMVPVKGSHCPLLATTFIFTSNVHPGNWWKRDEINAFKRRITYAMHCPSRDAWFFVKL